MAISAAERRFIMAQLGKRAQAEMIDLWDRAAGLTDVDFSAYVVDNYPDLAQAAYELAAEVSATIFESDFPDAAVIAKSAPLPPVERFTKSAQWALGGDGKQGLDRLSSNIQRAVFDGDRNTTVYNAARNGMRWIRVAQADSCAFCRLLATRTDFDNTYRSEAAALGVVGRSVNLSIGDRRMIASGQMTREEALARRDEMQLVYQIGKRKGQARTRRLRGQRKYEEKYHDDCRCTAKAIPVGVNPRDVLAEEEPEYAAMVSQWENEYFKARENAGPREWGQGDFKSILKEWRTFGDIA